MELYKASQNWANRPDDERFWTVAELHARMKAIREHARTTTVEHMNTLRVEVGANNNLLLVSGTSDRKARMTNWAFSQMAGDIGAPAGYLRTLPADMTAQLMNFGLQNSDAVDVNMLVHQDTGLVVRSVNSNRYKRVWNVDVTKRLLDLESRGWAVPPAYVHNFDTNQEEQILSGRLRRATAEQAKLSLSINEGDVIGPAGIYGSDEDMFVFMVDKERVIQDGSESGLMRGFFIWNSEVGKRSIGVSTFLFRGVCGNHIVWGAQQVQELNFRHVGTVDEKFYSQLEGQLKIYSEASASDLEAKIERSKRFVLKSTAKEDVIDFIFEKKILSRKAADAAFNAVVPEVDGAPYTAWGFAQGITRASQAQPNAEDRVAMDTAAGKVLDLGNF